MLYGGPLASGVALAMSRADSSDLEVAAAFFLGLLFGFLSLRWLDANGKLGTSEPSLERLVERGSDVVTLVEPAH